MDLPKDLFLKVSELIPMAKWRPKYISQIFGYIESGVIFNKRQNDYQTWRELEYLGNKIHAWINEDKERKAIFKKQCVNQLEQDHRNPDMFFKSD